MWAGIVHLTKWICLTEDSDADLSLDGDLLVITWRQNLNVFINGLVIVKEHPIGIIWVTDVVMDVLRVLPSNS